MKPLYIFDLDGTLALIQHRRHFVERERGQTHPIYNTGRAIEAIRARLTTKEN